MGAEEVADFMCCLVNVMVRLLISSIHFNNDKYSHTLLQNVIIIKVLSQCLFIQSAMHHSIWQNVWHKDTCAVSVMLIITDLYLHIIPLICMVELSLVKNECESMDLLLLDDFRDFTGWLKK